MFVNYGSNTKQRLCLSVLFELNILTIKCVKFCDSVQCDSVTVSRDVRPFLDKKILHLGGTGKHLFAKNVSTWSTIDKSNTTLKLICDMKLRVHIVVDYTDTLSAKSLTTGTRC